MESKLLFYVFKGLSLLPLAVIHSLGVVLGWLFLLIPNRERETARINIALCLPEFSASEQRRLLRSSLIENAKALLEMPAVWMGEPDSWVARFQPGEGAELPVEMLKRGERPGRGGSPPGVLGSRGSLSGPAGSGNSPLPPAKKPDPGTTDDTRQG